MKFKESTNNIKSTWKVINQLLNKNKKSSLDTVSQFQIGDQLTSDPYEISHGFNHFFANVGASLSNKIDSSLGGPLDILEQQYPCKLHFEPPQLNEVRDIIKNLKNTAAGHDKISSSLVKEVSNHILEPLTHILGRSMETGIVPKDLKKAKVIC